MVYLLPFALPYMRKFDIRSDEANNADLNHNAMLEALFAGIKGCF